MERLRRALGFAAGQRRAIAVVIALSLLAGALGALEPLVLRGIVDGLLSNDVNGGRRAVYVGLGALGGIYVLREAGSSLSNWLSWRVRLKVQHALLESTVGRLHSLSLEFHKSQSVGSLLTRLDRGIQGLVSTFTELAFNLLPSIAFLAFSTVLMLRLDWRLSLVMLALTPLPPLIGALAAPAQTRREKDLLDRWTRIYARFNEVLTGIVTVKSFAMEEEEKRRFIHDVDEANSAVLKGVAFDARVGGLQNGIVGVTRVVLVAVGALLILDHKTSVGTLLAFLGYAGGFFGPIQGLTTVYQTVRRGRVAYDTIFSILDAADSVMDVPGAQEAGRLRGEVELENVWFGYDPNKPILRGITFKAEPGSTVALVGPSGGGKTSLAVLLQRLYDPQTGCIRMDGIDLKELTQHSLRRQIGVVMQDALLFNDTVRANIAYGFPEAGQAEVEAAARAANAHDFIGALPKGYDTEVGERGCNLSVGQRQRIAIARALLKNPALVILDEATSALDAESETLVQEALERLLAGRTTFIIAHRLSTVVNADKILVLRSGRIIEEGTHGELVAAQGYYASLVTLQTRGLIKDTTTPEERAAARAPAAASSS